MYVFSILDLIPYIILYGLGIVFAFRKFKNIDSSFVLFVLMLIFSSIRYGIGYDYYAYRDKIVEELPTWVYEMTEPFDLLLINFCKSVNSSELYFAIYSFLTLYLIYFVTKRMSLVPVISLLIYMLYPSFFLQSMDVIRNSLAFSFILLSYYFLKKNNYIKYFISCIVAIQFHVSAFIGFILLLIKYLPNNKYFFLLSIMFSAFLGTVIQELAIFDNIPGVAAYLLNGKPVGSMKYMMIIVMLFNFITWDKVGKNTRCLELLKIECVGLCFFFLFLVDDTLSFRISVYFLMFMILALPYQLYAFKYPFKSACKVLVTFLVSVIIFQWYLVVCNYLQTGERMSLIPYQTIFYNIDYSNYVY